MALELITGRAGRAHIGSEDDRAYHAYVNGEGRYVLYGGTAEISNANSVHIDPTEFLVDGAHVRITGNGEDVAIENGVSSYKRIDVIALHYTRTGGEDDYIESIELTTVKGANVELNASPAVPEMPTSGTILDSSVDVYVPIFQLLIDSLTPKDLTALLAKYAMPVVLGGTGVNANPSMIVNLESTAAADVLAASPRPGVTGVLPVAQGGTGSNTLTANAVLLGNGTSAMKKKATANGAMYATGTNAEPMFGVLPIAQGGTGSTSGANALNALGIKQWLLNNVFKVGVIWESYTNTSPASILGGTWTPITGRFPYFNAGTAVGGANSQTLSVSQMPAHRHAQNIGEWTAVVGAYNDAYALNQKSAGHYANTSYAGDAWIQATKREGGSSAVNNMPAYQTVYAWRRTA